MLAARAGLVPGLPLMHPAFYIRPARVEEAAALSDLCFRSKAVWGYDPEFMALMLAALGVAGEDIAAGDVWVATGADGQIAGVVALAPAAARRRAADDSGRPERSGLLRARRGGADR